MRITHLPTGLVVECQDDRSQHKNKTKALSLLSAKLKRNKEESQQAEIASERKILVGTGDRSEKIRTYNFPQGRITDHRIKLTKHNLDQAMDGEIQDICNALMHWKTNYKCLHNLKMNNLSKIGIKNLKKSIKEIMIFLSRNILIKRLRDVFRKQIF